MVSWRALPDKLWKVHVVSNVWARTGYWWVIGDGRITESTYSCRYATCIIAQEDVNSPTEMGFTRMWIISVSGRKFRRSRFQRIFHLGFRFPRRFPIWMVIARDNHGVKLVTVWQVPRPALTSSDYPGDNCNGDKCLESLIHTMIASALQFNSIITQLPKVIIDLTRWDQYSVRDLEIHGLEWSPFFQVPTTGLFPAKPPLNCSEGRALPVIFIYLHCFTWRIVADISVRNLTTFSTLGKK